MSKDKRRTFTPAELKKHDELIVGKTLTIMCATLVDQYDLENYDLGLLLDRFDRYAKAVDANDITLKLVASIIQEQTGIEVKWANGSIPRRM